MKRIRSVAVVLSFLALAGCAVGPNYKRPLVAVPKHWTVEPARADSTATPAIEEWWTSFHDPELDSLVERAVHGNLDLKMALERVQEARASRGVSRSGFFPQTNADFSVEKLRGGFNQGVVRAVPSSNDSHGSASLLSPFETSVYQGSLSSSWELDVFGGIRRGVEAATADLAAQEENRCDVLVMLLGDVGRAYGELRGYQRRMEIAEKNIRTQLDTLDLTTARAKAGLSTDLDVSRAAAQLDTTRAAVPPLISGIDASIHRLGVLLGEEPGALRSELEQAKPIPLAGRDVDVGLPTGLLERRPDIRRAEAQVHAATARIGEAKADLFPKFVLSGTAGRQASQLQELTLGLGNYFSVGPGISLPLFNGGRIRANIAVQTSRERKAVITYQSTILNALEEVQNALVNYAQEQDRRDRLSQSVEQSQLAVDLSNAQYRGGQVDFLSVLEAQRDLFAAEDQLVQSQASVTIDLITLYRALGGGWKGGGYGAMSKGNGRNASDPF